MRFVYEYNTRENLRLKGSICAPNRDAAFQALRAQGVRPIRLTDAPGVLNRLFGKGKRWMAIAALAAVSLALGARLAAQARARAAAASAPLARQQLAGDVRVIMAGVRENWAGVLADPSDRLLAHFAQPGWHVPTNLVAGAELVLSETPLRVDPQAPAEHRQLVRIVIGMRDELARFVADGGTPAQYLDALVERQRREEDIFAKTRSAFRDAWAKAATREARYSVWCRANAELADRGLKAIPLPE